MAPAHIHLERDQAPAAGSPATADEATLLTAGVQGTLEPAPAPHLLRPDERLAGGELPPLLEALLAPLLREGFDELQSRMRVTEAVHAGEPIPLAGLQEALRERLAGLMTLAAADSLLHSPHASPASFWRMYPALRLLAVQTIRDWAAATALFFDRFLADAPLLAQTLGVPRLPPVATVSAAAADLHPGGAAVLRIVFHGAPPVFYKPRPVSGEWLWWALLEAIARGDPGLRLPAARVLAGPSPGAQDYGWMESLLAGEAWPQGPAPTHATSGYWECAGAVVCLAQHVRLTDLHLGNILATAHGPAVLDAECLATPPEAAPLQSHSAPKEFDRALHAIQSTGLLPPRHLASTADSSGLFGGAGRIPGLWLARWAVSCAGTWRLIPWPAALAAHPNRPACAAPVSMRAVAAPLCRGYRRAAEALLRVRDSLLSPQSAWRATLEDRHAPRCVLRDTLLYGSLLNCSLTPEVLASSAMRRGSIASALAAAGSSTRSSLQAELRALDAGYLPRFAIAPGSRTLCGAAGRPVRSKFCAEPPAASVLRELHCLTPDRLDRTLLPAVLASLL